ncbi:MAG: hypothetical protein LUF04_06820 [Bacteroides sp.]|nr:hypothetical protein [Bacteroides sp.]
MAEIEEIRIAVVCNTTQANNSIRSLRDEIHECTTAISGLTTAAGSCSTALDQLAEAQERLNEVNEEAETATADLTNAHEELEDAIGNIIKGFNAFKSASALLGIENEALNSTLDKLQAGLELVPQLTAITNGIGAVQTAFSAFGRILSGHPIFVLAAVITGITTAMVHMIDYSSNLLSGVDDLKEGHQDYVDTLQTQQDEQEFLIRKMKAQGDSQTDIIAANKEFTQQTLNDVRERVKAINAEIEVLKAQTSWYNFAKKKRLKELESQSKELTQLFEQTNEKLIQLDKDYEIAEIKENAEKEKTGKQMPKGKKKEKKNIKKICWKQIKNCTNNVQNNP